VDFTNTETTSCLISPLCPFRFGGK
jgi:hypothetical protein